MRFPFKSAVMASVSVAGLLAATDANASVMVATFTGQVQSGADVTGVFGAIQDLAGVSFVATFTYDPSAAVSRTINPGHSDLIQGGASVGPAVPSPMLDATMTINGHTVHFGSSDLGLALTSHHTVLDIAGASDQTPGEIHTNDSMDFDTHYTLAPISLDSDASLVPTSTLANFNIAHYVALPFIDQAYGDLSISTYTVTGGVPEPSVWLMMTAGLGLAGAMMRRARNEPTRVGAPG